MLRKIHRAENDVVVAMPLVYVGGDDILILAAEDFIGKPTPNLMGLLRRDLARLKGLYQVVGKVVALVHRPLPRFVKLYICRFNPAAE